jgi:purine nucleosidase
MNMSLYPLLNPAASTYVPQEPSPFLPVPNLIISEAVEGFRENAQKSSQINEEIKRHAKSIYGLGVGQGKMIDTGNNAIQPLNIKKLFIEEAQSEPFIGHFDKLFPQDTIRILYLELDPGVDDGSALLQLLAATKGEANERGKKFEILGIIPCVGNAVLNQTKLNTLQFLELADSTGIKVYSGAVAPLAIEKNQTAIDEMNQAINATHFYGHDGEQDVGGWPNVTMKIEKTPGYQYAASQILDASPQTPLTLISTSSLTELSKTFTQLEKMEKEKGVSPGSFARNINAISIMGGCLNPPFGCNAPFNLPPNQKTSEANFYFDSPATQHVFTVCRQYNIPILLASLDLTQQPELLWRKRQVDQLKRIPNRVAAQMAQITNIIPYIDKLNFPNGTWPNHDLQSAACLIKPHPYSVTRMAVNISSIGELLIDEQAPEEEKNVYFLSMAPEKQHGFFESLLNQYKNFN